MPHISITAEELFNIGSIAVTNSLVTSSIVVVLFLSLAFLYKEGQSAVVSFIDLVLRASYSLFEPIFGERISYFFPLVATFFLYIVTLNWFGLLPGVGSIGIFEQKAQDVVLVPFFRGGTADINTTIALAVLAIAMVQYYGVKFNGMSYIGKFFNFKSPIDFFLGILEVISELSRALSLAFRLFGNILAGEVLLTIVAFLIPVLASLPFFLFEIFVGFIQAIVFSMLFAIFLSVATDKQNAH